MLLACDYYAADMSKISNSHFTKNKTTEKFINAPIYYTYITLLLKIFNFIFLIHRYFTCAPRFLCSAVSTGFMCLALENRIKKSYSSSTYIFWMKCFGMSWDAPRKGNWWERRCLAAKTNKLSISSSKCLNSYIRT